MKKIHLLIYVLIICHCVSSPENEIPPKDYLNLGNEYVAKGELDKAEAVFLEGINYYQNTKSIFLVQLQHNLGMLYYKTNRYLESLEQFQKAEELYKQIDINKPDKLIANFAFQGDIYMNTQQYQLAFEVFMKAKEYYEKENPIFDQNVLYAYSSLVRLYFLRENFQQAEAVLNKAIDLINTKEFTDSMGYIGLTYAQFAQFYLSKKDNSKALEMYLYAIDYFEKMEKKDIPTLVKIYEDTAMLSGNMALIDISINSYLNAIKYLKQIENKKHSKLGADYYNLGLINEMQGKFDLARDCFLFALTDYKRFIDLIDQGEARVTAEEYNLLQLMFRDAQNKVEKYSN